MLDVFVMVSDLSWLMGLVGGCMSPCMALY